MADDPTRRKSARDKRPRDSGSDADEQGAGAASDQAEGRDAPDQRGDTESARDSRSSDAGSSGVEGGSRSEQSKTNAARSPGATRSRRRTSTRLTEDQIGTPKRQTLVLLGLVCFMTIALWVAAKAACNMRTQITRPRKVTTEQIVRTPKHAAIELQQRWAKGDFTGAQELASAAVAAELEKEKNSCDSTCVKARHEAAERTMSTAYVIDRDANATRVWVRTVGMAKGEQHYVLEVVRDQATKAWQTVSRRPARPGEKPVRPAPPPSPAESAEAVADAGVQDALARAADASAAPAMASASRALASTVPVAIPSSAPASAAPAASASR